MLYRRAVKQLSEGSKVLEDQLHLMDEKYLDLRCKLDQNRAILQKEINKVKKESDNLRLKYSVATNGQMLDNVSLKNYNQQMQMQQQMFFGTNGSASYDSAGFGFQGMNTFTSNNQNQFGNTNNLTLSIPGNTPIGSSNNLQEQYLRQQQQQKGTLTSPKGTQPPLAPASSSKPGSPKPGSAKNPHILNVAAPESPTAKTIGSPTRSNMIYINNSPTPAAGAAFNGFGGPSSQRPVSAFAGAQTTSDLNNYDTAGHPMTY